MDYPTYVERLRADGAALVAAAGRGLDRPVPSCPDWVVTDLVHHVGETFREVAHRLRVGGTEPPEPLGMVLPDSLEPDQLMTWVQASLNDLVDALNDAEPEDAAYSWAGDHRAAFWARRMALEAAVHRWDAENGTGRPEPLDGDLGADGVDEMFDVHIPNDGTPYLGRSGTVHLHRTDGAGEWVITLEPGAFPAARRAHERCDVAVRSTGSDLALFLWRRVHPSALEVFGDAALLDEFWAYLAAPGE